MKMRVGVVVVAAGLLLTPTGAHSNGLQHFADGIAAGLLLAPRMASSDAGEHHESAHTSSTVTARTVGELWRGVKAREAELNRLVQTKELKKVHEVAFGLRDLVAAMPTQSANLPADRLAKLRENVKFVATLAERLDTAGDANDQAGTERNAKQLASVLGAIESLYPEGALK